MNDPIRYAETRLSTMVEHGWPDYPFLLGDIRDVLAEIARLRTDLDQRNAALVQSRNATEAERAARRNAEADSAAVREALIALAGFPIVAGSAAGIRDSANRLGVPDPLRLASAVLSASRPGTSLLAELEAARAVIEKWRYMPRYYDDCDPGQNDPYYAWWTEMVALVAAYDETVKGRAG